MSKRVKSKATVSDSSEDSEEEVKSKKAKTKADKSSKPKASSSRNEQGDFVFQLTDKRRVSVRDFRGKLYVDIREFYEKDGEYLPGKKGISLNVEQWEKLKDLINDIDEAISERG
ncbi:uncharacterized protein [Porites lutea]|uniref:uncharacterized protein n=1 Tax=Porites lutea TaxID=51062 RepID=UPI003CC6A89C